MECIYKNISLDVHDDITSQLSISVKQGDTSRGIRVALTDHGKVFNIPDDCYAVFSARKSTGNFISDGCIIQNNTIIYNYSESVVSVATQLDCELTVYSSKGDKITSPSFTIFVYQTIQNEFASGVVESDSFATLNNLILDATATIAEANTAIEQANSATEAAVSATEEARNTVTYIRKTSDGKLEILDADHNLIETIDVCYMDNDTIYRYENGVLSVRGIKDINSDETFRMWIGTTKECLALTHKDEHTFYWITDDATFDEVMAALNAQNETLAEFESALKDGSLKPKNAEHATNATTADNADIATRAVTADRLSSTRYGNANLNALTIAGLYHFDDKTLAAMCVNLPNGVSTTFELSVTTGIGVTQELTTSDARRYLRNRDPDEIWSEWVEITHPKILSMNSISTGANTEEKTDKNGVKTVEISIDKTGLDVLEFGISGGGNKTASAIMMISDLNKSASAITSSGIYYQVDSGSGHTKIECEYNASQRKIIAKSETSNTAVYPTVVGVYRIGGLEV